jgi:hypothetical protein
MNTELTKLRTGTGNLKGIFPGVDRKKIVADFLFRHSQRKFNSLSSSTETCGSTNSLKSESSFATKFNSCWKLKRKHRTTLNISRNC